jgi:hypothetical protein
MQQLISIETYQQYVGQPFGALPDKLVRAAYRARHRPTVKAILCDGIMCNRHPVATYRSAPARANGARVFNLPGGGIEKDESWIFGLGREFKKELPESSFRVKDLENAVILAVAELTTTRTGFDLKTSILVGIMLPPERFGKGRLRPDGKELSDLVIHESIGKAALRLAELPDTRPDAKAWYQSGFSKLRQLLNT